MRQGQPQNRQRSRGRGNNNNRGNNRNQLNRSMESNGPDVRIRGTASHIAEKYQQLARDAQSAGDNVAAESYWQHAEHYNRLIATAQAAIESQREDRRLQQQNSDDEDGARGEDDNRRNSRRGRRDENDPVEASSDDDEQSSGRVNGSGPQPKLDETPAEVAAKDHSEDNGEEEEKPARKPRMARRPRRSAASEEKPASEAVSELPAFISGSAE